MRILKRFFQFVVAAATIVYVGIGLFTGRQIQTVSEAQWDPKFGRQADGTFMFTGFENSEDFKLWKMVNAALLPSNRYTKQGALAAKAVFYPGDELSAIIFDDLILNRKLLSDWSGYKSFVFHLYNHSTENLKLAFLVTDLWGSRYRRELELPPRVWQTFEIPVAELAKTLNIQRIDAFSISLPHPDIERTIFLDDIRLVPSVFMQVKPSENINAALGAAGNAKPQHAEGAVNMLDYGFANRKAAWMVQEEKGKGVFVRVPFIVKNETEAVCASCEAEGGVPFPMGELNDLSKIRLRDAGGRDIAFQSKVLAEWPDKSVKWLHVCFEHSFPAGEGKGFYFEYGPRVQRQEFESELEVIDDGEKIKVNTGALAAVLDKKSFYLFESVGVDQNANGLVDPGEEVIRHASLTLTFRDKEYRAELDRKSYKIQVEEKGGERVVVRASAWYQSEDGARFCQAIVRFYFYRGKSYVRLAHTLIYTGYPENRASREIKMVSLPDNETITSFGIQLPFKMSRTARPIVRVGDTGLQALEVENAANIRVLQQTWDKAFMEINAGAPTSREAFTGWMDVTNEKHGVTVAVRDFRENFPKALGVNAAKSEIDIDLWPKEAGDLDLATTEEARGPDSGGNGQAFGLGKTHEILLDFHEGRGLTADHANRAMSFKERLLIRNNPFWLDATGAFGRLMPVDTNQFPAEEKMLDRMFNWAARHPVRFKWYGMLNYGDTLTWWRSADEDEKYTEYGWHPVGRWGWYNCEEVGTHTGALTQFARSGEWKYFEFGENLSRHLMDVDTIHYNTIAEDKRLRGNLNDRFSQVGSMHRHNANHWGDVGDEASHTNVTGLLRYYYLTGDERALDVIKEIGEYFLREPFTYFRRFYLAPQRTLANVLWGDVLLYELTWDDRFKKGADKLVEIFKKGLESDGSILENYNPVMHKWSGDRKPLFMTGYTIDALINYHELTQSPDVMRLITSALRYLAPVEYSGEKVLHGFAYAFLVTNDMFFLNLAKENLAKLTAHQKFSEDPMMDGLIYEKMIYHQPNEFLYPVPYVFAALQVGARIEAEQKADQKP